MPSAYGVLCASASPEIIIDPACRSTGRYRACASRTKGSELEQQSPVQKRVFTRGFTRYIADKLTSKTCRVLTLRIVSVSSLILSHAQAR